jgi:hypothetical protein
MLEQPKYQGKARFGFLSPNQKRLPPRTRKCNAAMNVSAKNFFDKGVGTRAQRNVLAQPGCHKCQGFFHGKPQLAQILAKSLTVQ